MNQIENTDNHNEAVSQPEENETAEPRPVKEELATLLSLLRAHIAFQQECLQFTRGSIEAIRESLAGIESE